MKTYTFIFFTAIFLTGCTLLDITPYKVFSAVVMTTAFMGMSWAVGVFKKEPLI